MKTIHASPVLTLLLIILVESHTCVFSQEESGLARTVSTLGRTNEDPIQQVRSLAVEPAKAVGLLITQLRTIEETRILSTERRPNSAHVLWCIRALRYLTGGKDFCAPSSHKFGDSAAERNRKYWLEFRESKCLPFFALWPSRGSEYIAPVDTQRAIIESWRTWYAAEGRSYIYHPLANAEPSRWLW